MALVRPDKIIVANVGDSRAVLCRNARAVDLTTEHRCRPLCQRLNRQGRQTVACVAQVSSDSTRKSVQCCAVLLVPPPSPLSTHSALVPATDMSNAKLSSHDRVYGSNPVVDAEIARVEAAGGWVADGRVCDVIAVSRAFGDLQFKEEAGRREMLQTGIE